MDDRISKEAKLKATTDILASYLRGGAADISPEKIGQLFKEVYQAIDETVPDGGTRKIGLG